MTCYIWHWMVSYNQTLKNKNRRFKVVDASEITVGSKVLIQVGEHQFEAEVFSIEDEDLFQTDGEQGGLQVVTREQIVKILFEPESDDAPNPAPASERTYVPKYPPLAETMRKVLDEPQKAVPKKKSKTSEKPLSLINAAHKVLLEEKRAMSCPEMVLAATAKGYWKQGTGKTPAQTLYASILREMKSSNERFKRSEVGGKFCAGS